MVRARWLLLLVVAGCGGALVLEAVLLPSVSTPDPPGSTGWATGPYVTVLDVDLIPTYENTALNDTNYLGQVDCACGPLNVSAGTTFGWWIRLGNSDPVAHTLREVAVDGPFTLIGTTPATPVSLPASENVTITIAIQGPTTGGAYDVTGGLWIS